MLLGGELDAGILGSNMPKDPRLRTLIPDPDAAAKEWAGKHDVRPINHMFVVAKSLCDARPDAVRSLFQMLVAARATADSPFPSGLDGNWKALELVSEYAFQQGVVPRRFSVDELFAEAAKVLDR
jgi:4,5-dihydroxyphthalate decarboxylase